jgi:hypothetical protein
MYVYSLAANGFELPEVRFKALVNRILITKITVSMHLQCKMTVFREAAFIANALMSARIFGRLC